MLKNVQMDDLNSECDPLMWTQSNHNRSLATNIDTEWKRVQIS